MNVRELSDLETIKGFDGEYASFKTKGTDGIYYGLINRNGEVVWYDDLCLPISKLRDSVYFSMKRKRNIEGLVFFDVALKKYIDKPQMSERPKSKAELIAGNCEDLIYTNKNGHVVHMRSMHNLNDKFLSYAECPKKWGVKDLDGNIVIPAQFDFVSEGGDDIFIVERDNQYGIIDLKGNWVIPFGEYEWLWWRGDYFLARKDGKAGIIDLKGKTLIPFEYEYLHPAYSEGLDLISAKKNGEFFFINSQQERLELF